MMITKYALIFEEAKGGEEIRLPFDDENTDLSIQSFGQVGGVSIDDFEVMAEDKDANIVISSTPEAEKYFSQHAATDEQAAVEVPEVPQPKDLYVKPVLENEEATVEVTLSPSSSPPPVDLTVLPILTPRQPLPPSSSPSSSSSSSSSSSVQDFPPSQSPPPPPSSVQKTSPVQVSLPEETQTSSDQASGPSDNGAAADQMTKPSDLTQTPEDRELVPIPPKRAPALTNKAPTSPDRIEKLPVQEPAQVQAQVLLPPLSSFESLYDTTTVETVGSGGARQDTLDIGDRYRGTFVDVEPGSFENIYRVDPDQEVKGASSTPTTSALPPAMGAPPEVRWSAPAETVEPPVLRPEAFDERMGELSQRIDAHWTEIEGMITAATKEEVGEDQGGQVSSVDFSPDNSTSSTS